MAKDSITEAIRNDAAARGADVETPVDIDDIEVGDELVVRRIGQTGDDKWELATVTSKEQVGYSVKMELDGEHRTRLGEGSLEKDAFWPGEFEEQ